jgi:hypothetical protein
MMQDMRLLLPALLLSLGLPGLLAGCGGDDHPTTASGPGLPSQAELKSYFEAITGSDPDVLAQVQTELTAAGSPARGYAAYAGQAVAAAAAAGQPVGRVDVEEVDGGFKACAGDTEDQCATWSDLTGKDGKLVDFALNGTDLTDLLVDLTGQAPIASKGLYEVQPEWAYRQPKSGKLVVVLTVTASDVPLSPKRGVYIEGEQVIKGGAAPSPATIEPGTSSPIVLAFPGAQDATLDGQVTFDLELGDHGSESIGFGLKDPAAS